MTIETNILLQHICPACDKAYCYAGAFRKHFELCGQDDQPVSKRKNKKQELVQIVTFSKIQYWSLCDIIPYSPPLFSMYCKTGYM